MKFDLIFDKALIYDGTGRLPFRNDVGIVKGKIAAIGNLEKATAKTRVDVSGLALCPGFIDVHTHAEMALHQPAYEKIVEPLARQGITTFVGGNCGAGLGPISDRNARFQYEFYDVFLGSDQRGDITWNTFGEMLETHEKRGLVQNCAFLAPHGVIRAHPMGDSPEPAKPAHIADMKDMLRQCLEEGAVGMSTGLMYYPGLCSDQRELMELAHVCHQFNAVFTSHIRSYNSDTIGQAIDEVLEIGRIAQVPVQISHLFWVPNFKEPLKTITRVALKAASTAFKVMPFPVPADSGANIYLKKIDRLIQEGHPIGVDAMPTSAGFTHLFAFFPPWSLMGGMKEVLKRVADPITRAKIRKSIEEGEPVWPHRGPDSWSMNLFKVMGWECGFIMSTASDKNKHLAGKSFVQLGKEQGKHPFDAACDLALEEDGRVLIFETPTYPGDELVELSLRGALLDKNVSIATDTIPVVFGRPSHLTYDCFPKFLGKYSREKKMIALPEAIRKCTSLPASQLQIRHRGSVKEGFFADLVIFDPQTIGTTATATDPAHFPTGIDSVYVNGQAIVDKKGYHPEIKSGRVIRRWD
ncbi:MAG: amidohydrolase family protein [Deltaproteobacteria bacterium]|nr:amidohydrolase family protein [Deltaproteobacteria bacterium]